MFKMCVSNYTLCFIGKNLLCFYKDTNFYLMYYVAIGAVTLPWGV